jgi:hypothetical protein
MDGIVLIGLAAAIAPEISAQGHYMLTGATLGSDAITVTIPKSGIANTVHQLSLVFKARGMECKTGKLTDRWSPNKNPPYGVTLGFDRAPMSAPSGMSRSISFHVLSTTVPTSRVWTVSIPHGACLGMDQLKAVTVNFVKAP